MTTDDVITQLLERAAGPTPGAGDAADVRRRARRYARRRRTAIGAGAAVLLVPGLFAAGRLQDGPDDEVPAMAATAPGDLLFERPLADGSTLRVSRTDTEGLVAVEWPDAPAPVRLNPAGGVPSGDAQMGLFGDGSVIEFALVDPDETEPPVDPDEAEVAVEPDRERGPGWLVVSVAVCPDDPATQAQARLGGQTDVADAMALVDGLAVLVVPVDDVAEAMNAVTVEALDAGGTPTGLSSTASDEPGADPEPVADDDARYGLFCGGDR